jgi:hypothetical protein
MLLFWLVEVRCIQKSAPGHVRERHVKGRNQSRVS